MREVRALAYKVLKFFDDLTSAVVAVLLMLLAVYAGYALWDNQQVYTARPSRSCGRSTRMCARG